MLEKLIDRAVFAVSFFIYSGFYAVLALAITILGSGGSRFASVPVRLLTTILMTIIIISTFFNKSKIKPKLKVVNFIFILFWIVYSLKILWHLNSGEELRLSWLEYILYSINFAVLPFYMYSRLEFNKYKNTIINALIGSGFLMGITTLYLYKDILAAGVARIHLYVYQNPELETLSPLALSYASILTIMLCIYKLLYDKKKSKLYLVYLLATIGLSLVMFLLGASRGSVLAFSISLMYLILQSNSKVKLKIGLLITAFIPILIWSVAASGSSVFERTTNSVNSGSTGREKLWADAINEFLNNPIFGGRIEIGYYPHNFILEILMATGLIGLLLIGFLLIKGFKTVFYAPKIDQNYIWVSIIFLQGFCQYLFSSSLYQATLVFFPLGLLLSLVNKQDKKKVIKPNVFKDGLDFHR